MEDKRKLDETTKLEQKLQNLQISVNDLLVRDRENNSELQKARKIATQLIADMSRYQAFDMHVISKNIGHLSATPFFKAAMEDIGPVVRLQNDIEDEAEAKAEADYYTWLHHIQDSDWFPFKVIETDGKVEQVLDKEVQRVKLLRSTFREEVVSAILTALSELVEQSSGRFSFPELWNKARDEKASLSEAIVEMTIQHGVLFEENEYRDAKIFRFKFVVAIKNYLQALCSYTREEQSRSLVGFFDMLPGIKRDHFAAFVEAITDGSDSIIKIFEENLCFFSAIARDGRFRSYLLQGIGEFLLSSQPKAMSDVGLILQFLLANGIVDQQLINVWCERGIRDTYKALTLKRKVQSFMSKLGSMP